MIHTESGLQMNPDCTGLDMLLSHPQVIIGAMLIIFGGLALIILDHIDFTPKRKKDEDTEDTQDEGRQAD